MAERGATAGVRSRRRGSWEALPACRAESSVPTSLSQGLLLYLVVCRSRDGLSGRARGRRCALPAGRFLGGTAGLPGRVISISQSERESYLSLTSLPDDFGAEDRLAEGDTLDFELAVEWTEVRLVDAGFGSALGSNCFDP